MSKKKEVVICNECKGLGTLFHEQLVDHHKGDCVTFSKLCEHCNALGVRLKITTVEYKVMNEDIIRGLGEMYQKWGH